jgi:hypothetical protein
MSSGNPEVIAVVAGVPTSLLGFILPDVANDFDPAVTGLAGRVGAMVGTIDGTKAWLKTGTGNTDWRGKIMQPTSATWYKLSDGTAAVDMQVLLITQWIPCGTKDRPSVQNKWPAGPVGTFSLQFSNVPPTSGQTPPYNATATDYPSAALGTQPTQPTGAADNNIISVDSIGWCVRELYTPTPGQTAAGAAKLPTETTFSFTASEDL